MSQQTRNTLYGYFESGDKPTEAQFIDLIDSAYNITDDGDVSTSVDASDVTYDNTDSGLSADNVQDALDEVQDNIITDAADITYDDSTSGIEADTVQNAIDQLKDAIISDAENITYDNTNSSLGSTNVQDAVDELVIEINDISTSTVTKQEVTLSADDYTTVSALNDAIAALSYNLGGGYLIIQFTSSTSYDYDDDITISGFYNGLIRIESTTSDTQATITSTSNSGAMLNLYTFCPVKFRDINFTAYSNSVSAMINLGINSYYRVPSVTFTNCTFDVTATTSTNAFPIYISSVDRIIFSNCVFDAYASQFTQCILSGYNASSPFIVDMINCYSTDSTTSFGYIIRGNGTTKFDGGVINLYPTSNQVCYTTGEIEISNNNLTIVNVYSSTVNTI